MLQTLKQSDAVITPILGIVLSIFMVVVNPSILVFIGSIFVALLSWGVLIFDEKSNIEKILLSDKYIDTSETSLYSKILLLISLILLSLVAIAVFNNNFDDILSIVILKIIVGISFLYYIRDNNYFEDIIDMDMKDINDNILQGTVEDIDIETISRKYDIIAIHQYIAVSLLTLSIISYSASVTIYETTTTISLAQEIIVLSSPIFIILSILYGLYLLILK